MMIIPDTSPLGKPGLDDDLLTLPQVAALLRLSIPIVRDLLDAGILQPCNLRTSQFRRCAVVAQAERLRTEGGGA
jgi:hypothetical protein